MTTARRLKDPSALPPPRWFIESFYFAFWGSRTASPISDPKLSAWSLADFNAEVARIEACASEDDYLRISRAGAAHRMDRCAKRAWWAVIKGGIRW